MKELYALGSREARRTLRDLRSRWRTGGESECRNRMPSAVSIINRICEAAGKT